MLFACQLSCYLGAFTSIFDSCNCELFGYESLTTCVVSTPSLCVTVTTCCLLMRNRDCPASITVMVIVTAVKYVHCFMFCYIPNSAVHGYVSVYSIEN